MPETLKSPDLVGLRALLAGIDLPLVERTDSKGFSRLYQAPEEPHFATGDLLAETFGDGDGLIATAINALPALLDELTTLRQQAGNGVPEDDRAAKFWGLMGTKMQPDDLDAYARELESIIDGQKKHADRWRHIANEMGYEPGARNRPPLPQWLADRVAMFRQKVVDAASPQPPSLAGDAPGPQPTTKWASPSLDSAYRLVEKVRDDLNQHSESAIDEALRRALDAIETADCELVEIAS